MCKCLMMCQCGEVFPTWNEITIISGINMKLTTDFWGSLLCRHANFCVQIFLCERLELRVEWNYSFLTSFGMN